MCLQARVFQQGVGLTDILYGAYQLSVLIMATQRLSFLFPAQLHFRLVCMHIGFAYHWRGVRVMRHEEIMFQKMSKASTAADWPPETHGGMGGRGQPLFHMNYGQNSLKPTCSVSLLRLQDGCMRSLPMGSYAVLF